ncbi:hypothetical protein V1264_014981 [Littorina saxatilis]|uniref:Uncharacterized protein n=1 Tax=Littorina saxatilis TaxID=31220 RepID=A0AAN9GHI7_9CAEN
MEPGGERRLPHRRIPNTAHPCCCPQCLLIHLRTTIGLSAVSVLFPELCQEDDKSYGNSGRGGR